MSTDDGRRSADASDVFLHSIFPQIAKNIWKRLADSIILVLVKQIGDIKSTGTWGGVTFYKMEEEFYARKQSTLTAKRFWNDKAFGRSRRSCNRLERGNKLASFVYRGLAYEDRAYALYCELKSKAIRLLKERKAEDVVLQELYSHCEEWKRSGRAATCKKPKSPQRKQSLFYFTGSEDMPLRLSRKDILDLEQGTHEDMLRVVGKLRERLEKHKKKEMKANVVLQAEPQEEIPATRQTQSSAIVPRFAKSLVALLTPNLANNKKRFRTRSRNRERRHALFRKLGEKRQMW